MENVLWWVLGGAFIVLAFLWWKLWKKIGGAEEGGKGQGEAFLMMQGQLKDISRILDERMKQTSEVIEGQFGKSASIIRDVTERLTKLDETNRQVVGFADQLKSFENILKNPKQRGILGEYMLETVLKNILPPAAYELQYKFQDGEIVDAAIFTKEGIVPVDSKFSLENYNKIVEEKDETRKEELEKVFKTDLKRRIDETSKYIRPKENTTDFAFMFIPAEGIYYDLLVNQVGAIKVNTRDLIEYAFRERRVIIVSPTTFYAYLQTIMQGLRALKIEESAKEIRKRVEDLGKHLGAYESYFKKVGNNLSMTVNSYNSAYKELGKIDKDVIKISGSSSGVEVEMLDRPKSEEE